MLATFTMCWNMSLLALICRIVKGSSSWNWWCKILDDTSITFTDWNGFFRVSSWNTCYGMIRAIIERGWVKIVPKYISCNWNLLHVALLTQNLYSGRELNPFAHWTHFFHLKISRSASSTCLPIVREKGLKSPRPAHP